MRFTDATYLWGLLGLLLPIAIHLWSRKKVQTIKIGSTKLMVASKPKQTSKINLNELWLLLLRMLAILVLTLILAEPSFPKKKENSAISYLIEPSLINDEQLNSFINKLPRESIRIFKKGFPEWEDTDVQESQKTIEYWQLAQQLHTIPSDSIVIFTRGWLNGIKGKRPILKSNTKWIVVESNLNDEAVLKATRKNSYLEILSGRSDNETFSYKKDSISLKSKNVEFNANSDSIRLSTDTTGQWLVLNKIKPIKIGIVQHDSLQNQVTYIQAAYRAISKYVKHPIEISILDEENLDTVKDTDVIVSFQSNIPVLPNVKYIHFLPNEFADDIIEKGPTRNKFYLTQKLNSENIVSTHLAEKLLRVLDLNDGLSEEIASLDNRRLSEIEIQPTITKTSQKKYTAGFFSISPWLWALFILILIVERILSKLRHQ